MSRRENEIGTAMVDCVLHLHQDLGAGLLESVYEVLLPQQRMHRAVAVAASIRAATLWLRIVLLSHTQACVHCVA